MSQKNTISGVQFCYHRTPQQGLDRENKLRLSAEMEKLKKMVRGAGRQNNLYGKKHFVINNISACVCSSVSRFAKANFT